MNALSKEDRLIIVCLVNEKMKAITKGLAELSEIWSQDSEVENILNNEINWSECFTMSLDEMALVWSLKTQEVAEALQHPAKVS